MPRYLDPKSDLVFKKIFGLHPELLKDFLNAILPLPLDCLIESLTYLPTENVPEIPGLKHPIVDVLCLDNQGRRFIVEMQLQWSKHFIQRMVYNTAATYVHQLKEGESYDSLSPVYGLAVIDATFTNEDEWFHHFQMTKAGNPEKNLEEIQLVLIELPKLKPTPIAEKKLAVLWLRFLKETNDRTEEADKDLMATPLIKKALKLTEISAYSADELRAYRKNWDAISSAKTLIIDNHEKGLEEGEIKGEVKGLVKGKAEGLAEGEAKGKAAVIKSMHHSGLPIEQICQIVELTKDQVQKIIESNK